VPEAENVAGRSEWQSRVEGTWYGHPAVFTPDGSLVGFIRVQRTVRVGESGAPEILVTNELETSDPSLADRIGARELVLRITENEHGRVYDGRDFDGSGRPYGRLLVGQDFIRPWGLDTVVAVQVLPDGESQLYSNFAHLGPRLVVALGGRYVMDPVDVEAFLAEERAAGSASFDWSDRTWAGEVEVHDGTTSRTEQMSVSIAAGRMTVEGGGLPGALECALDVTGNEVQFGGPQVYGNGQLYGPMLVGSRHVNGRPLRLQTRDVQMGGGRHLAIAWQHWVSGDRVAVVNGVLVSEVGA
jgi:hypothetical protein